MNETIGDIVREMREFDDDEIDVAMSKPELLGFLDRIEAAHKAVADELAKQQAYDAKLEADFAALREAFDAAIANADRLAEINRRLRDELGEAE